MLGGIQLEEFKGMEKMPQKAASAWVAVEGGITGAGYKPLLYVGSQVVKGVNHWFVAEQTLIFAQPERHIVKIAVNEFNQKIEGKDGEFETVYKIVPHSIEVIF